jgi:hypothetical protein
MPTDFRDWSPEQQRLFLRMYRHMRLNQSLYLPQGAPALPAPAWNVISGAAARMAAQMLDAEPSGDTFAATLQPEE